MGAAFDTYCIIVANEFLRVGKLFRQLVIQVSAVGYHDNRGTRKEYALHQQTVKKEHGEAFAAAGGSEVGSPLAVASGFLGLFYRFI